jgi:hypothetical protein
MRVREYLFIFSRKITGIECEMIITGRVRYVQQESGLALLFRSIVDRLGNSSLSMESASSLQGKISTTVIVLLQAVLFGSRIHHFGVSDQDQSYSICTSVVDPNTKEPEYFGWI